MTTPAGGGDVTPASRDVVNERLPSVRGLHRANAAGTTWQAGKTARQQQHTTPSRTLATLEAAPGKRNRASIRMARVIAQAIPAARSKARASRMDQPTTENMMGHPISTAASIADWLAASRAELRNAKALADKLQTLLDSKTHQVEALHAELESTRHANELIVAESERWQARCEEADSTIDAMLEILRPHAAPVFDEAGTPLDAARYIASRLTTDAEPDIDTVPLADLLEAIGTYLEHDQSVTIRGSFEPTRQVEIHALGLTFCVDTQEASEALTKAHELGQCLTVQQA